MESNKIKDNIFLGSVESVAACRAIYSLLMTHEWVNHSMMLAKSMDKPLDFYAGKYLSSELKKQEKTRYNYIKRSVTRVITAINKACSIDPENPIEFVIDNGKTKGIAYLYKGEDPDPLAADSHYAAFEDMKAYWQFCQDSAGLLPSSWLDYFFKNTKDLFDMKSRKSKGQQYIKASVDRDLKNIEILPELYEHIVKHEVVEFDYLPFNEPKQHRVIHPQYLHESNGRWHLLGYEEGAKFDPANISLDRIDKESIEVVKGVTYSERSSSYFADYFKNVVGLTHDADAKPTHVRIRAYTIKMYGYVKTKPIHSSQEVIVEFGQHEDGCYGEFDVFVESNNEFYGRVLQMGGDLEIVSPDEVRGDMSERVKHMASRYDIGTNPSK